MMLLAYIYTIGDLFFEIGSKAQKRKGFFWKIFIFLFFLYHTFFHSVYNNNKNQKNILYKWLCIAWYMGISYFFFVEKKKISRSLPVIFHTMYKTNFFFILIHSLGTFSLCGVVCLSKKEGIKKMQTPKKVGGFFFQKLKLFFNKGIFLQTKFFFSKRYFA